MPDALLGWSGRQLAVPLGQEPSFTFWRYVRKVFQVFPRIKSGVRSMLVKRLIRAVDRRIMPILWEECAHVVERHNLDLDLRKPKVVFGKRRGNTMFGTNMKTSKINILAIGRYR